MKNPMTLLLKQARRPKGWLGAFMLRGMNKGHSKLTDWGLAQISIEKDFIILDVGCGGGRTIHKMAQLASNGKVFGIDISKKSVEVSRKTNSQLIKEGRVEITNGSVSQLPYSDNMFDLITTFESHYFWPDLVNDMKEVLLVLKPGGNFLIIGEVYKGGNYANRHPGFIDMASHEINMALPGIEDLNAILLKAGFSDINTYENIGKKMICSIGKKGL
ncbi:MAG TPA: class I SAM-dependent methyltransferase [Hanamia sp.]|nr:class I SAM-dependent methyltransferase [Hanamia sp.]